MPEKSVMACDGPLFSQVIRAITGHHMEGKLMPNANYEPQYQPNWMHFDGLQAQTRESN